MLTRGQNNLASAAMMRIEVSDFLSTWAHSKNHRADCDEYSQAPDSQDPSEATA